MCAGSDRSAAHVSQAVPPGGRGWPTHRGGTRSQTVTVAGAAAAGSVEVAHNGEPQALVGSQTNLSPLTGLSFDLMTMQRRQ
jgi:hypothetical protein